MDINSLLSPQDSPARETPPPPPALNSPSIKSSSKKRAPRQIPSRTPSGLSQQITSSPQPHLSYQQQQPSPNVTYTNGSRVIHSAASTPPERPIHSPRDARVTPPNPLLRQASTPGMDTLAGANILCCCKRRLLGRDEKPGAALMLVPCSFERCIERMLTRKADLAAMQHQHQQQAARQSSAAQRPSFR